MMRAMPTPFCRQFIGVGRYDERAVRRKGDVVELPIIVISPLNFHQIETLILLFLHKLIRTGLQSRARRLIGNFV